MVVGEGKRCVISHILVKILKVSRLNFYVVNLNSISYKISTYIIIIVVLTDVIKTHTLSLKFET